MTNTLLTTSKLAIRTDPKIVKNKPNPNGACIKLTATSVIELIYKSINKRTIKASIDIVAIFGLILKEPSLTTISNK